MTQKSIREAFVQFFHDCKVADAMINEEHIYADWWLSKIREKVMEMPNGSWSEDPDVVFINRDDLLDQLT